MTPAELLYSRFVLRDDVYPRQNRNGEYHPVHAPLTLEVLEGHLQNKHCIGVYQLSGSVVKWICLDVDGANKNAENAREAVRAIVRTCRHFGLRPTVERSGGKGWHVWIFTEEMEAAIAQAVGKGLLREAGDDGTFGCQGVEVFPKQIQVGNDGFGNLVKLPWGKRADNGTRGVLVDAETLEPLERVEQFTALLDAPVYPFDLLRDLVNENGWLVRETPPATDEGSTWRRNGYSGDLPCFEYVIDPDSPAVIPDGHRNNVLFAFANQRKRSSASNKVALRDVLTLARERCNPPYPEAKARATVDSVYRSVDSSAGCEIIQAAGLCPVLLHGVACPIFQKVREKDQARREVLMEDDTALSITPLRVSRGEPPIYTATVRGRELRLSLQQLVKFQLFKERCAASLDFIPELPFVPSEPGSKKPMPAGKVWDLIVDEALAGVIEEDAPPEDASPRGAAWDAIREFLGERKVTENRDGLLKGQVVTEEGNFFFRGQELRRWLKLTGNDTLAEHELWLLVRDHGGTNGFLRTSRGSVRCWKLPTTSIEGAAPSGGSDESDFSAPPMGLQS